MSAPKPLDLDALKGANVGPDKRWTRTEKPAINVSGSLVVWIKDADGETLYYTTISDESSGCLERVERIATLTAAAPEMLAELERWREVGREMFEFVEHVGKLLSDRGCECEEDVGGELCLGHEIEEPAPIQPMLYRASALLPDTTNQG